MVLTDQDLVQHEAHIEGSLIVVDGGEMYSPDEFAFADLELVSFTAEEEAELTRLGILRYMR